MDDIQENQFLAQGAEARVYISTLAQTPCLIKERFSKGYRHPVLDARLTDKRLTQEARMLAKARKIGLDAPALYFLDTVQKKIYMELVPGITAKLFVYKIAAALDTEQCAARLSVLDGALGRLAQGIGRAVATLHDEMVIHGDLTTSNIILRAKGEFDRAKIEEYSVEEYLDMFSTALENVTLIDFGLSYGPAVAEDKAVDLYVLERAFLSTHPKSELLFNDILENYKKHSKHGVQTLKRLDLVRLRGRKKIAFG